MVESTISAWGSGSWRPTGESIGHEAMQLVLDPTAAQDTLGWRSCLDRAATAAWTVEWYAAAANGGSLDAVVDDQLGRYAAMMAS